MKRVFKNFLLISVAAAMFTACGKDSDENELEDDGADGVSVPVEKGAIKTSFSISEDKKVYFSMGNLQYQASTNTWRFAERQYDMIGSDNQFVLRSYSGWIDLFCYGTSGWDGGVAAYQPYTTSTNDDDFYRHGLLDINVNADWGVYNKISNGGNEVGMWRTLTYSEWSYMLHKRPNASDKKGVATIDGVSGLVILPDDWTLPKGVKFKSGLVASREQGFGGNNKYSLSEWRKMEAHGAVFLPAAGYREGTTVFSSDDAGCYWTATYRLATPYHGTDELQFTCSYCQFVMYVKGYRASSVRLVQDVK